jgi:hypothetical protein
MIGVVERGYTVLDNATYFPAIVNAMTASTSARIIRAGEWGDGAWAFMTLEWPEAEDINVLGIDRVKRRMLLTVNHTGKQSALATFMPYRFWCSNGVVILVPGCDWMFRLFHKRTVDKRLEEATETIQRATQYWDKLPQVLEVLAHTPVSDAKALDLATHVFDPTKNAKDKKDGTPNEAKGRINRFMELFHDQPGQGEVKEVERSAWWALQAGVHMMDHDRGTRVRKEDQENTAVGAFQRFKAHWPGNQAARDKERLFTMIYTDRDLGIKDRVAALLN